MTQENRSPPPAERSGRITAAAWIALALLVAVVFAGAIVVSHKPGVPAVAPGQNKVTTIHTS